MSIIRKILPLLVAGNLVGASWLRWTDDKSPTWVPQETGRATEGDAATGWTPKPTPGPGIRSEGEQVLDLLRRETTTSNWTNPETCGWVSGSSSYPWTCGDGMTCATNSDHIVACASGTYSPFYSACLDHSAYQAGKCGNIDSATGCCEQTQNPACGTYIWTGKPVRSLFRCFQETTVVSMLDEPQFVIDASLSSKTASKSSSSDQTTDDTATATSDSATTMPGSGGSNPSNNNKSSPKTNIGAIVGGVIGGVVGLILITAAITYKLRLSLKKKSKKTINKTVNDNPDDTSRTRPDMSGPYNPHTPYQARVHHQGHPALNDGAAAPAGYHANPAVVVPSSPRF